MAVTYQRGRWSKPKVISARYEEESELWEQKRDRGEPFYRDYINSRAWKQKVIEVRMRDENTCQHCGRCAPDVILNVHHLTYDRLGEELLDDLITLCNSCHRNAHRILRGKARA